MRIARSQTNRGFTTYQFKDRYDADCSIQMSSLATEEAIWFGLAEAEPKILASKLMPDGTGWVAYPLPEDVFINTQMHLTRELVQELLPILEHFAETGEL